MEDFEEMMEMEDFEKMMEAEGVKPAKDDFRELVDFIVDNRDDLWAIEDAIAAYSDELQTKSYKRGYEDAIELMEKIMRENFEEAFEEVRSNVQYASPFV